MPLNLPYYYGHSDGQYAFFRIPKLLRLHLLLDAQPTKCFPA